MKTKYVTEFLGSSITATTSCADSAKYLAKRITQQPFAFMLASAIMIGLAAFATPLAPASTLTVLHSFAGSPDGSTPYGSLVRDSSGNLYGTTYNGGTSFGGTVFKTTPSGVTTVLHSFAGGFSDGQLPYAGLVMDASGNLYGTTSQGGTQNDGTVFKITQTGTITILHSFTGTQQGSDGAEPYAGLTIDSSGNLYGTTYYGGKYNMGTVFKTTSGGTTTVLYSFSGVGSDGSNPWGGVVRDSSGNLYGTTYYGGSGRQGVLFKLSATNNLTLLLTFGSGPGSGAYPHAGLILDSSGNLYGTTCQGGTSNLGTVFTITNNGGNPHLLHSFTGQTTDGACPYDVLVRDSSGNLFGTTLQGGTNNVGVVFKVASTVTTLLHSFAGTADGSDPWAGLVLDSSGNLFGTASAGGAHSSGTVFKLVP